MIFYAYAYRQPGYDVLPVIRLIVDYSVVHKRRYFTVRLMLAWWSGNCSISVSNYKRKSQYG